MSSCGPQPPTIWHAPLRELRTFPRPPLQTVFSVGTDSIQITWRRLPGDGVRRLHVGSRTVEVDDETASQPGSVLVDDLRPATTYACGLRTGGPRPDPLWSSTATTLTPPPGERLCRIATINDVHIGSYSFGITHSMRERPMPEITSGTRCARAAMADIDAAGIDALFIKGDLVHKGLPGEWIEAERLLSGRPWPVEMCLGNHELRDPARAHDGVSRIGMAPIKEVRTFDLPGVTVLLAESGRIDSERGTIAASTSEIAAAAADINGPMLMFMHHNLQAHKRAWMLPTGIPGDEATPFLDRVGAANPNVLIATGHTHRHRRREHGPVTVVEVGSPKDYPGTWAFYDVYETGVVQVVRRVSHPDAMAWTERTRTGALGAWGRWSPGRLSERCFVRRWDLSSR